MYHEHSTEGTFAAAMTIALVDAVANGKADRQQTAACCTRLRGDTLRLGDWEEEEERELEPLLDEEELESELEELELEELDPELLLMMSGCFQSTDLARTKILLASATPQQHELDQSHEHHMYPDTVPDELLPRLEGKAYPRNIFLRRSACHLGL